MSRPKVVVVGAGVTGLTNALILLKNGFDVSVIAKHLPGDYELLSSKAGAQWSSHAHEGETVFQNYDKPSYYEFIRLANEEPSSGVTKTFIDHYYHKENLSNYQLPWFKDLVPNLQELNKENFQFPSNDIIKGFRYPSVTITTPHYLAFLQQKVLTLGGTLNRINIKHIDDANKFHHSGKVPDLIINATALGSYYLGGVEDHRMYPIKGQIIIVSNTCKNQKLLGWVHDSRVEGECFYIMNRKEGGSIIGGTYQPLKIDQMDYKIDEELNQRILSRALKYAPELVKNDEFPGNLNELDIVTNYVAYRPGRIGGIRLERKGKIIHNYGAGGTGYQSSYGTALKVLELANEYVSKSKL